MSKRDFSLVTTKKPVSSLTVVNAGASGRNNQGRITTRHKGGGARKFYRIVSFSLPEGFRGTVEHIEYDPNRSANLARIKQDDGRYNYILATQGMKIGQEISVGEGSAIENGNRLETKAMLSLDYLAEKLDKLTKTAPPALVLSAMSSTKISRLVKPV